jgi:CBS domain-containing protein
VNELMVPVSEYATVSEGATLLEAVKTLRSVQAAFDQSRYRHRAILVFAADNKLVGKLSQHDVLEALEPNYKRMMRSAKNGPMHRLGLNSTVFGSNMEQYHLWEQALENLCEKGIHIEVKNIMYTPGEGEFVSQSTTMDEAIHRLISGRHHSLLVTADQDSGEIVGVLRLTDVFEFVSNAMLECE